MAKLAGPVEAEKRYVVAVEFCNRSGAGGANYSGCGVALLLHRKANLMSLSGMVEIPRLHAKRRSVMPAPDQSRGQAPAGIPRL